MTTAFAARLLAGITLAFCAPILFTGGILGNFGDVYQYAAPFRHFAAAGLQAGRVPLWNPHLFAGAPFLASPQSAIFYPPNLCFSFLPLNFAFNFFASWHAYLNALGMFLLLRALRRSPPAALMGAAAWAFSFFFLSKVAAGHVIHLSGYAWAPFAWLFALRSLAGVGRGEGAFGFSFWGWALSSWLQFLSGHLQVWLHTALLVAAVWAWLAGRARPDRRAAYASWLAGWIFAFGGLALVQAFPTLIYSSHSFRVGLGDVFRREDAYRFAVSYSMEWKALLALVLPGFFGNPVRGDFFDREHPSLYFETYALYFGWIPLALAVGGLVLSLRRRRFFLAGLCALSLLLAAGQNSWLYRALWPWFSFLRVPARFYFLFLFAAVSAAALFWDQALRRRGARAGAVVLALVLADLFIHGRSFLWSEAYPGALDRSQAISWMQGGLSARPAAERIFSTADIGNHNKVMLFALSNANGYEAILQKSLLRFFAATQGGSAAYTTGVDVRHPGRASFALFSVRYLAALDSPPVPWPLRYANADLRIYENPSVLAPVRPAFALRWVSDPNRLLQSLDSGGFDPAREILALGQERAESVPQRDIVLSGWRRDAPEKIRLQCDAPQPSSFWLFLSEAHYPGWEVWAPSIGRRVPFQADGYFQAVFLPNLPAGRQDLYWLFRPKDFLVGAGCGAAAAAGISALGLLACYRRLRAIADAPSAQT